MPSMISTPGKIGLPGKCPWKIGSLTRDVLDADGGIVAIDIDDAVDHQERVAVRQQLEDGVDVERARASCPSLPASRSSLASTFGPFAQAPERRDFAPPLLRVLRRIAGKLRPRRNIFSDHRAGQLRRCREPMVKWPVVSAAAPIITLSSSDRRSGQPGHARRSGNCDRSDNCDRSARDYRSWCPRRSPYRPTRRGRQCELAPISTPILDDHAAELRNLAVGDAMFQPAKTFRADPGAGVQHDIIAEMSALDADIGGDRAIAADGDARTDHGVGADHRAAADLDPRPKHNAWAEADFVLRARQASRGPSSADDACRGYSADRAGRADRRTPDADSWPTIATLPTGTSASKSRRDDDGASGRATQGVAVVDCAGERDVLGAGQRSVLRLRQSADRRRQRIGRQADSTRAAR